MTIEAYNTTAFGSLLLGRAGRKHVVLPSASTSWLSHPGRYGSEYFEAVGSLREIAALNENWDGYGAARLESVVVSNAWRALDYFANRGLIPEITPNAHGTISLEWESQDTVAHFEVGRENYAMYVRPSRGATSYFNGKAVELLPELADSLGEALGETLRPKIFKGWSITPISYEAGSRMPSYQ